MEIVLMGYMGSGKSTIGKLLSEEKKITFIDLDEYIEEKEKMSIKNIFKSKGEIYFRLKEAEYLKEILDTKRNYVLSLGGGTPCYGKNLTIIKQSNSTTFYLKSSILTLFNRLRNSNTSRPLIDGLSDQQLQEYLGKHLFERAPFYESSMHKIQVDNITVKEITNNITTILNTQ